MSWTDKNGKVLPNPTRITGPDNDNYVLDSLYITRDTIIVLNVKKNNCDDYTLTLNRNPTAGGTVTGAGTLQAERKFQ